MTKAPNLPSLTGQYLSTTQINAAFEAIEEAFENTLSLDGSTPNSMQADLDMDSNDILNAKRIEAKTIVVDGVDVRDLLDDLPGLLNGTYTEYVAIYDGDGTSSPLTLPLSVDDPDRLLVIVNGSVVRPDYDYTVSNFSVFPTGDLSVWPHGEKNITIRLKREVDFAVIQDSDINSNGFPLSSVLSAGGPGTTRALLVSLVAAGWNPAVGTVVQAAGLSYRRESGATAIADLPGWVPDGPFATLRHFTSTITGNMSPVLAAAAAWARSPNGQRIIDGEGLDYKFATTFNSPPGERYVIRNIRFFCHADWVSVWPGPGNGVWLNPFAIPSADNYSTAPFINIPVSGGGVTIEDCWFDGRKNGLPAADFILDRGGSNYIRRNRGRGCANFGYWVTGGGDKEVVSNNFVQWRFNQPERGVLANLTAALFVCETGDVLFTGNIGHGGQVSRVNLSNGSMYIGNHWYSGADAASIDGPQRRVCTWDAGGRARYRADYVDNGELWITGQARPDWADCKIIVNGAKAGSLTGVFRLMATAPGQNLNGLRITGFSAIAKRLSGEVYVPMPTSDFFIIDETYARYAWHGGETSIHVYDNLTFLGKSPGNPIPSMRAKMHLLVDSTEWGTDGAFYTKTVDLREFLFMPNSIPYYPTARLLGFSGFSTTPQTFAMRSTLTPGVYTLYSTANIKGRFEIAWDSTSIRYAGSSAYFGENEPGGINLSILYEGGATGAWWDARYGLWKDAAKTVPATAEGDLIYAHEDRLSNLTREQPDEALRPVLRFDQWGNPRIDYSGGKWLAVTMNLSEVSAITVYGSYLKADNSASQAVMNHNAAAAGSFRLMVPSGTGGGYGFTASGGTPRSATIGGTSRPEPELTAVIATADLPGDEVTIRSSVAAGVSTTSEDLGATVLFTNGPVRFGQRTDGSAPFAGMEYQTGIVTSLVSEDRLLIAMRMLVLAHSDPNPSEPDDPDTGGSGE